MLDLERTVATNKRHWAKAETASTDQDAYLNSVALNLNGFLFGTGAHLQVVHFFRAGRRHAWWGCLAGELLRQMALDVLASVLLGSPKR